MNPLIQCVRKDSGQTIAVGLALCTTGSLGLALTQASPLKLAALVCLMFGILATLHSTHQWLRPMSAPGLRDLNRFENPTGVLEEIEQELNSSPEEGKLKLLETWVVAMSVGISAFRYEELVAARIEQSHHKNHINFQVKAYLSSGKTDTLFCRDQLQASNTHAALLRKAAWCYREDDLEKRWVEDKETLITEIGAKISHVQSSS